MADIRERDQVHPTVPPAWLTWYHRYASPDWYRGVSRDRSGIAIYAGLTRGDRNYPYLTLQQVLNHQRGLQNPTKIFEEWENMNNVEQEILRSRVAPNLEKVLHSALEPHPYMQVGSRSWWAASWAAWATGILVLVLVVLAMRAAERCLDRKLAPRRRSSEWQTPNVRATSQQHQSTEPVIPPPEPDFPSTEQHDDSPPPYTECAPNNKNTPKATNEEPPPPYSACTVSLINKDIPGVHFRNNIEGTSFDVENVRNSLIETQMDEIQDGSMRLELVFDNGRVVERTVDVDVADIPEVVAEVGRAVVGDKGEDCVEVPNGVIFV